MVNALLYDGRAKLIEGAADRRSPDGAAVGRYSGRVADLANPITAMPVVNAIPAVCGAAPGIRTYADLPLITGRYRAD